MKQKNGSCEKPENIPHASVERSESKMAENGALENLTSTTTKDLFKNKEKQAEVLEHHSHAEKQAKMK